MLLSLLGGSLFSPGHWHKDFRIGLGLDLSGGTELSMKATTLSGGLPTNGDMQEAITIILARVNGTGNTGAEVQTEGANILNVSVPGKTVQQTANLVSETALLMFRQTLLFQAYTGTTTSASASASPSATPSASASSSATASPSSQPSATPGATATASTSAKIVQASASPTASGTSSPTASASASTSASASASASPTPSATSSASSTALGDPSLVQPKVLALFNKLVCKPNDSTQWKTQVGYTTAEAYDNPNTQIVACDSTGDKYALDVAKIQGTQVSNAIAELSTTSNEWVVELNLKSGGAAAYGTLTSDLYNKYYTAGGDNSATDDFWLDTVAIVLDGNVVTSPEIISPIPGGNSQITGNFTQASATQLQNVLKYGSLPLNFKILSENSVSATLGQAQLDGGLIAAAIGLALVVIYSFLYYRGLGVVSVSSLIIAGVVAMLAVMLLTKYQSFTLDLAGIAGLIVAIGITADSFVVFFERLRDEVREGKALRPAVEAGWKRARRTILVSDTVSFLAALLLYYFAIGEVKGFAYTLGLTTLIDVIVVFLFTKPMVTLLARTRFFGNGHPLSGLDPARLGARTGWRSSVRRNQVRRRPDPVPPRNPASRNPASRNTE